MYIWDAHRIHRLRVVSTEADRIEERFGLNALASYHSVALIDRDGTLNLPFQAAEQIAMEIAAREPQSVLLSITQYEEELLAAGYEPGMRHRHDLLRRHQPAFALAKQWAGLKSEADLLTKRSSD